MDLSGPAKGLLVGGAFYVGVQIVQFGAPGNCLATFTPAHAIGTVQAVAAASTNSTSPSPITHDQVTGRPAHLLPPGTLSALYFDSTTSIKLD
jgi:hypothetical protein